MPAPYTTASTIITSRNSWRLCLPIHRALDRARIYCIHPHRSLPQSQYTDLYIFPNSSTYMHRLKDNRRSGKIDKKYPERPPETKSHRSRHWSRYSKFQLGLLAGGFMPLSRMCCCLPSGRIVLCSPLHCLPLKTTMARDLASVLPMSVLLSEAARFSKKRGSAFSSAGLGRFCTEGSTLDCPCPAISLAGRAAVPRYRATLIARRRMLKDREVYDEMKDVRVFLEMCMFRLGHFVLPLYALSVCTEGRDEVSQIQLCSTVLTGV